MSTWKKKLENIKLLRQQRKENTEKLYASKIGLLKIDNTIVKIKQKRTFVPVNLDEIKKLRSGISNMEIKLRELDKSVEGINSLTGRKNENASAVQFLEKKIKATSEQIADIDNEIKKQIDDPRPDERKIHGLQKQQQQPKQLIEELQLQLVKEKNKLHSNQQQLGVANNKKETLLKQRKSVQTQIETLQAQLNNKVQGNGISIENAEEKRNNLIEHKKQSGIQAGIAIGNLNDAINAVYTDPHPSGVIKNLDDDIPFLLMPVKIETRFIIRPGNNQLWLRIYPDEIAIHTHEKILTDMEVVEGEKYWKAIFNAEKNGADDKDDLKKSAWSYLADLFGSQRAAWVAKTTKPSNWSADITGIANEGQLQFPVHDLTATDSWSRAPRTNVMPDKFVVRLYERNNFKDVVGKLIPDELFVGPDPLEAEKSFIKSADNTLVFGESFNWTSDFDQAVEKGMGFKIDLTGLQSQHGFDKILLLGVYLSADEIESKEMLEDLIDNHHYSPKGFSIIKQGTATNNTEADGSGFSTNDPFNNTSYFVETGDPLFQQETVCDGKNLADALGIDYEPLQYVMNSDATDLREAKAMNQLLYPSTLGDYFDTMLNPVLDEQSRIKLRNFFLQHVFGRGGVPAIRVGNQPYGVLLTSNFKNWKRQTNEPLWGNTFYDVLYNVISNYQQKHWIPLINSLMYVGKPNTDPSEVLLNILGLQPGSVTFFQRTGFTTDDLKNQAGFTQGPDYTVEMGAVANSEEVLTNFLEGFGYNVREADGKLKVPLLLQLIFQHYHTGLNAANLIDDVPLSETNGIRFYNDEEKNYLNWLQEAKNIAVLEQQDFGAGKKAPVSLLYLQARRSLLLEISKASVKWFGNKGINVEQALATAKFRNIDNETDITKWEVMKAKVKVAVPAHAQKEKAIAEYLLTDGRNESEAVFLKQMKQALQFLSDKPTGRLERCFTEHIDTCTYRLDAWQSGFFHDRLLQQRKVQPGNLPEQRKKGIYLGAYGWVENIRPAVRKRVQQGSIPESLRPANGKPLYEYNANGGFVHTPSMNHASAAAVLRSGYLNHATPEHPDTMAVNLSSERVRRALSIMEGIRNGQTLDALLGYQFERGLHDRGSQNDELKKLNAYIYDFRRKFTIVKHQVLQQGVGASATAIPANNVINGMTLAESSDPFPYGATGPVTHATQKEKQAIEDEKSKLSDSLDAVKDLLLSESVYQMVQGNFDRTGAIMNAMKDMHIPPELDVINTPRSSHFSFTNRVTIQFKTLGSADEGYNPWTPINMTPPAIMESGINAWLGKILGQPAGLICFVSHSNSEEEMVSIDKLNIQPIDLVYMSGHELNTGAKYEGSAEDKTATSELESRIAFYYRKLKILDDDVPVTIKFTKPGIIENKKTIGSILSLLCKLKTIITDSRSIDAQDFDSPSRESMADTTNPKGYIVDELLTRVQESLTLFTQYHTVIKMLPVTKMDGSDIIETTLGTVFDDLDLHGNNVEDIDITFEIPNALTLQNTLINIANFRLADSFPHVTDIFDEEKSIQLISQASNVFRKMKSIILRTNELIAETVSLPVTNNDKKVSNLLEAGKLIFGDVLNILPLFYYNNPADIQLSDSHREALLKHAKTNLEMNDVAAEWMQRVSHVRPRIAKWDHIHTLHEILNNSPLELKPIQLPYRSDDSWLAVQFPSTNEDGTTFTVTDDTLSIIIHGDDSCFGTGPQSGLLVDEWTELIPSNEELTGVTFNYNQPNALPPQALLLVVPSQKTGSWGWEDMISILNDTLQRAKTRAVEPMLLNKTNHPETGVLLPALLSNFSHYDLDISLDYRKNNAEISGQTGAIPVTALTNN